MRDTGHGPEPIRNPGKTFRLDMRRTHEVTVVVHCGRCPQRRRLGEILGELHGSTTEVKAATGDGLVSTTGGVWRWRCPGKRCRAEHPTAEADLFAAYASAAATHERRLVLPVAS